MLLKTSEAVGIGHPDKIADRIADSILDAVLAEDKIGRVACEVLVSNGLVAIAGEITSTAKVNYEEVARKSMEELGYEPSKFKFAVDIKEQSLDIEKAAIEGRVKSGDQSIVYGYATDETDSFLPLSSAIAWDLVKKAEDLIENGVLTWAKHDMKALVSIGVAGQSYYLKDLLFSIQHIFKVDMEQIRNDIFEKVIVPVVEGKYSLCLDKESLFENINKSGRFVIGGLDADTGTTNRKLVVDSYGTNVRCGGGGFCGKDLTKIDRVGAYYARWICKNFVASGVCRFMELQLVYSFGSDRPDFISLIADSDVSNEELVEAIEVIFPFTISELVERFNTGKFSYKDLNRNGHFGDVFLPWERTDKAEDIKDYFFD